MADLYPTTIVLIERLQSLAIRKELHPLDPDIATEEFEIIELLAVQSRNLALRIEANSLAQAEATKAYALISGINRDLCDAIDRLCDTPIWCHHCGQSMWLGGIHV